MAKNEIRQVLDGLELEAGLEPVTIGVHFRGTDFAAILKTFLKKHDVGAKYYQKAFQFIRDQFPGRQLIFLVVTDDLKLARHTLRSKSLRTACKQCVSKGTGRRKTFLYFRHGTVNGTFIKSRYQKYI